MDNDEQFCVKLKDWINNDPVSSIRCPQGHTLPRITPDLHTLPLTSCPACAFAIRYKAFHLLKSNDDTYKWQYLWLKHCLSGEGSMNFIFATLSQLHCEGIEPVCREDDVRDLLQESLKPENGPLRKAALTHAARLYYLKVCEDWFLKRYNRKSALWCFSLRQEWAGSRLWLESAKFIYPRIIASIIIGFLPLVFASENWMITLARPWWVLGPSGVLALVLSLVYLQLEVKGNLEPGFVGYAKRARKIFGYSVAFSLAIGLFLLLFYGGQFRQVALATLTPSPPKVTAEEVKPLASLKKPFSITTSSLDHQDAQKTPFVWVWWHPEDFFRLWLFDSSLALLIGIIVQVLWEEKPITHPI